jgi:hypothetical protein
MRKIFLPLFVLSLGLDARTEREMRDPNAGETMKKTVSVKTGKMTGKLGLRPIAGKKTLTFTDNFSAEKTLHSRMPKLPFEKQTHHRNDVRDRTNKILNPREHAVTGEVLRVTPIYTEKGSSLHRRGRSR